jgi:hypothetical protein
VLPARATLGQLFKHYSADIGTEILKHSIPTTTNTSILGDKHRIKKQLQKISGKYLYSLYFFFTAQNW